MAGKKNVGKKKSRVSNKEKQSTKDDTSTPITLGAIESLGGNKVTILKLLQSA